MIDLIEQANDLKAILSKANPTLADIQEGTILGLDDLCWQFMHSRIVRQQWVIQSVVVGALIFSGEQTGKYPSSLIVRNATMRNLRNTVSLFMKTWPGNFIESDVLVAVKQGALEWTKKVEEENKE